MSSESDSKLVAACLKGDTNAWDALIDRYHAFIYGLALRMGLSEADADDVFQNVCLKFYQHLNELRDVNRLPAWLATVIRQEVWRIRRYAPPGAVSLDEPDLNELDTHALYDSYPLSSPEQIALAWERQFIVRQSFLLLSEECQRLLGLLYSDDASLNYTDVAGKLAIPIGSIGPKRARCLERLRKILQENGY